MCGDPTPLPAWMAEELGRHYEEWQKEQQAQRCVTARLENEYTTSPVVTVNTEPVAWLNSPMLLSPEERAQIGRLREQWALYHYNSGSGPGHPRIGE